MILLTGGAGFIGSHIADKLAKNGESIVIVDDFNDYYPVSFKRENIKQLEAHPNVTIIEGDIADDQLVNKVFDQYEISKVIHMAARAGVRPSIEDPLIYERTNVRGTTAILEAMKKHGCKEIYYASSSSVYGNQTKIPFSETDNVDNPISPYAATKKATELIAHTYHHLYGIKAIGFRFFTVYGERGRPDMAPYLFTQKILTNQTINKFGDGNTKRDYTYVEDIVAGVLAALDVDLGCEIFNLGNNSPVSLNEFIDMIEEITGKKAVTAQMPKQPGDVDITYADISKAQRLLGYKPQTSFKDGMAKFVNWFVDNKRHELSKIDLPAVSHN